MEQPEGSHKEVNGGLRGLSRLHLVTISRAAVSVRRNSGRISRKYFDQFLRTNRFRDVIVHSGLKTTFSVSNHRVRGHGDDGQMVPGFFLEPPDGISLRSHPSPASERP